jgi:hypothetical protein
VDVWIVIDEGRHADVDALPYTSQDAAVTRALALVPDDAEPEPLTDGMKQDGWVLYVPYGTESDRVRVVRRTVNRE